MEKFILKSLLLSSFILLAASCGKKEEDLSTVDSYTVISGNLAQNDTTGIGGSGDAVLRFNSTLPGVTSNKAIEVRGTFEPAGSLSLVFNTEDLGLSEAKGVIVRLSRASGALDTTCTGSVSVNGHTVQISTLRLSYMICMNFDFFVEVHNTPTSVRVLIWRKESGDLSIANADVDSSIPAHFTSSFPSGGGQGIFAGMKLHNVLMTGAQVIDAKVTVP